MSNKGYERTWEDEMWDAIAEQALKQADELTTVGRSLTNQTTPDEQNELMALYIEVISARPPGRWLGPPPIRVKSAVALGVNLPAAAAAAAAALVVLAVANISRTTRTPVPSRTVPPVNVRPAYRLQDLKQAVERLVTRMAQVTQRIRYQQGVAAVKALQGMLSATAAAAAAAMAGTAVAVSLQDFRNAITKAADEVRELLRRRPIPPGGKCDKELQAFKEASKAAQIAFNALKKSDELSHMKFHKAYRAFVEAYNALLQCMGVPPKDLPPPPELPEAS
jgi:hypothetical protein